MDQKLTNSVVDKINTKLVDFHQRRITNAARSVDQNDYVIRAELHENLEPVKQLIEKTVSAVSDTVENYTIVYTKGATVSTSEMCPDFIVGSGREGIPYGAWLRCKIAPVTFALQVNFQINGVTLLASNLSIPIGAFGPVFVTSLAISNLMIAGTVVTPVIVAADGSVGFVTAGVLVKVS